MKTYKRLVPFGMIGALLFVLFDILGVILWPGYNPITMYISVLVIDEAPNIHLMRFLLRIDLICLLIFSLALMAVSFRRYHIFAQCGSALMFVTALISAIGYGGYPIGLDIIFSKNNIIHIIVTASILCASAFSILLIAIGYLKQKNLTALGYVCFAEFIAFIAFNLWHLYALLSGSNILGLIERLTF